MADIVDDFLQRLRTHLPNTPPDRLAAIELDVRQHWGGSTQVYIGKRPALQKQSRLAQALASGQPLDQAFQSSGVSRRQGYRLIGKVVDRGTG